MSDSVSRILKIVRQRGSSGEHDDGGRHERHQGIRLSGTSTQTLSSGPSAAADDELGAPQTRDYTEGWLYPDNPRGVFVENQDPYDRLQDIANTHLSEGPTPGRIPHAWNNRIHGKLGRDITGADYAGGDNGFIAIKGNASGSAGDGKYVPHTPTPRNTYKVIPHQRTVDDSAPIPGVYVADATRR